MSFSLPLSLTVLPILPLPLSLTVSQLQPKEQDSELICFYYDNHRTPGLVIRPVKVEIVFLKPRLFILRSVTSPPLTHMCTYVHSNTFLAYKYSFANRPVTHKAKNMFVTRDIIAGYSGGYVKCIAVKGEIATVGVWSLMGRTQYPYVPI